MTTTATQTAAILIPKGTIVGYSFQGKPGTEPITGTVTLAADAIIDDATRDEDGCWRYGISPKRTYFCAGGLATVLPAYSRKRCNLCDGFPGGQCPACAAC